MIVNTVSKLCMSHVVKKKTHPRMGTKEDSPGQNYIKVDH